MIALAANFAAVGAHLAAATTLGYLRWYRPGEIAP